MDDQTVLPIEEWREVPGFPLYEVSDFGRVRSKRRTYRRTNPHNGAWMTVPTGGRIINGCIRSRNGLPMAVIVALRRDGQTFTYRIHRLVLLAFVGSCPDGMEGCHNDGNPLNNALANLRWDTHAANIADCVAHGTKTSPPVHFGESHHKTKITGADVKAIRAAPKVRGTKARLARQYGISQTTVDRILKREVWRHVA
jgi:hypothetical protein